MQDVIVCCSGRGVGQINDVALRRALLVLGWLTASGVQIPVTLNLSRSNQPLTRSTQPGYHSMGR